MRNGISIGSAVFAQITVVSNTHTHTLQTTPRVRHLLQQAVSMHRVQAMRLKNRDMTETSRSRVKRT